MVYVFNPSSWEAEKGDLCKFEASLVYYRGNSGKSRARTTVCVCLCVCIVCFYHFIQQIFLVLFFKKKHPSAPSK